MKFQRASYRRTEADLVGEFYFQARLAGLEVYLEVKVPSTVHRCGEMRVDAVVVNGDEVLCCVEAKREGRAIDTNARQIRAYATLEREHRIQTIWINSISGIPTAIASIVSLIRKEAA